jgi:hypothetical protein
MINITHYEQDDISESDIYPKLKEAEIQTESTTVRYSHAEVMDRLRAIIAENHV